MKRSIKYVAGLAVAATLLTGAVACSSSDDGSADVLQYGYYTPTHVYVAYSQPVIVHVTRKVYLSDTREYSSPSYEKTYTRTHVVQRQTTTTTTRRTSSAPVKSAPPQDKVPMTKSPARSTTSRTTTTTTRTTSRSR